MILFFCWNKKSENTFLTTYSSIFLNGAIDGIRTHDPLDHNQML